MGESLGPGVTHSPLPLVPNERMAWILERILQNPNLPDRLREPAAWPEPMRKEWQDHHRAQEGADRVATGRRRSTGTAEPGQPPQPRSLGRAPKAFAVFGPPLAKAAA